MKILKLGIFAALALAGAAEIVWLRQGNARLRAEAAGWRVRNRQLAPVREENRRLLAAAPRVNQPRAVGPSEPAESTNRAVPRETRRVAPAAEISANRDPGTGLVALEHFRNVGRASPGAAFQTAIWAIVQGEDTALAEALALTDAAREKAAALLAELPETARVRYSSPAKLVGLFFSAGILIGADGFQIVGQDFADARHATVRIRTKGGKDDEFPMRLGPDGWQMIVPEPAIDAIKHLLSQPMPEQAREK